jgi:ribonuclease D
MNNQQMLDMTDEIERTDRVSIPPRWRSKWRETLLAAVDQVRQSDPATWPQRPKNKGVRSSEADRERIDILCKARDKKAAEFDIESSLLASRAVLEDLVLQPQSDTAAKLMEWQRGILAEAIPPRD